VATATVEMGTIRENTGCESAVWRLREYLYASSPANAVTMLRQGSGKGRYIAGGTDLLLFPPQDCDFVVDINGAGLGRIARTPGGGLYLGSTATLQMIAGSSQVAGYAGGAVARAAHVCGNRPVRTVATLGGNLCSALPSADMVPVLLALDAIAHLGDGVTQQSHPLTEFFTGPRVTILGDRLLLGVELPSAAASWRAVSRKLTRTAEDLALVHIAVALDLQGRIIRSARIALGAVAPVPLRATSAEGILTGLDLSAPGFGERIPQTVEAAAEAAAQAAAPIDDHRASAAYRRAMIAVLVRRLIHALVDQEGA